MRQSRILFSLAALLSLSVLGGCAGAKEQLGLTRTAPDEFAVAKRAPLEMPPDYTLRPPQPGAPRPQEASPEREAEAVVFGDGAPASAGAAPNQAESVLLRAAGASDAANGIRQQVDAESDQMAPKDKPVAERLIGWTSGSESPAPASVVDAKAEAERLKKNAEEGKPVTEGQTPAKEE